MKLHPGPVGCTICVDLECLCNSCRSDILKSWTQAHLRFATAVLASAKVLFTALGVKSTHVSFLGVMRFERSNHLTAAKSRCHALGDTPSLTF